MSVLALFFSVRLLVFYPFVATTPHQNLSEPTRTQSATSLRSLGLLVSSVSNRFDKNDKKTKRQTENNDNRYSPTVILSETKDLLRDDTLRTLLATWLSLVGSEEILR